MDNIDRYPDTYDLKEKIQNLEKNLEACHTEIAILKNKKPEFKEVTHDQFIEFIEKQIEDEWYGGSLGAFTFGFITNLNQLYRRNQ